MNASITRLRYLALKEGSDPAVFTTLLLRITTSFVPFISVLIAVRFLTLEEQGYWYLFGSILAMAGYAELGFGQILSRLTAIEWGKRAHGAEDSSVRIQNLFKVALTSGLIFGGIICVITSVAGYFWISTRPAVHVTQVHWRLAWWLSSIAGPLLIALSMVNSFFEGCQLVATVNVRRFVMSWAGLAGSIAVFVFGGHVLGFAGSRLLPLAVGIFMVFLQHKTLIASLGNWWTADRLVSWLGDIWPLQWRYALSWSAGILINALYVPVVFNYVGPEDSGRFGLSMNILNFVFMTTTMLAGAKSPKLAMLYGQRRFSEMRHELRNMALLTSLAYALLALGFLGAVVFLRSRNSAFSGRLIPFDLLLIGLVGVLGNSTFTLSSTFARSLNAEPFVTLSIVQGLLTIACLPWVTSHFGLGGAVCVYSVLWTASGLWSIVIARTKWRDVVSAAV
jgi:O-antigen/teichoic acid export membrane protein